MRHPLDKESEFDRLFNRAVAAAGKAQDAAIEKFRSTRCPAARPPAPVGHPDHGRHLRCEKSSTHKDHHEVWLHDRVITWKK